MSFLSKKAQGSNYMGVVLFLFFFGFFNILGYTVWLELVTAFTQAGFYTGPVAVLIDNFSLGFQAYDYVMVLLLIILVLGTGLLSFRISTKTAFFILTIIMGSFWGFVSYFFNYVFIQMVTQDVFAAALGFFPRTILICTNLHWVMLAEIIVGSLTLYGKKEKGQFLT